MITYDEYKKLGGKLSEAEFDDLEPLCVETLNGFINDNVPYWRIPDDINEMGDFKQSLVYQIDFISSKGGTSVFNGSMSGLSSVTTQGFSFSYSNDGSNEETTVNGIPVAPMFESSVIRQLRKNGYMNRCL